MADVESARDDHRLPCSVTPRNYKLLIEPDFDSRRFCGSVTISADVDRPVESMTLNNDGLVIEAITVDGAPATFTIDEPRERMTIHASPSGPKTSIHIDFSGSFNEQLVGFYLSDFTDLDGNARVLGTTQFEAPHARKAFPCWDEPAYKATYDISLRVPSGMESVSNAGEIGRDHLADGSHTAHFATTMVMSTYLVAWIIGPLEFSETRDVDGVPLRVVSKPGMSTMTEYALDAAEFALSYFAEYFGVPYPGDKVDLIGIPDFAFGAMENLGCITFREAILMIDPAVTTQAERQRSVDVINHELAHMWFGDLVTMSWWEGIWLNEAFATFMEMKCTDEYRPDWNRWADFGLSRSSAFATDALASTRPIEYEVRTPEESEGMFDVLTYEKGAAVVRMLEQHLGEEAFRRGLRLYMDKHAYGNTVTTDLWDALEEATGQPVREMMDGWIYQGGFPLIDVTLADGIASLTQKRCVSTGGGTEAEPHRWQIPLRYTLIEGKDRSVTKIVLEDEPVRVAVPGGTHLVVNSEGASFVRIAYPPEMLESLSSLEDNELSEVERYALIDDAWASVLAGTTSTTTFLTLLEAMAAETSRSVWQRITLGLDRLSRLVDGEALDDFRTIAHDILSPMLANLGLAPVEGERARDRQLRADLVKAMGTIAEDPDVQQECQRTVSVGSRDPELVDPALMSAAVTVAASVGDQADFDDYVDEYRTTSNPQEKLRYLYGLTAFPSDDLVAQFRAMVLDGDVRAQDAPYAIRAALGNRTSGLQTWQFIKQHWDQLARLFPSAALSRMLEGVVVLDTPEMVADVASFIADHPLKQAEKTVEQILEQHRVNAALRARSHGGSLRSSPAEDRSVRLTWLTPSPLQVWAVEPGAAQLTWGNLPRGQLSVETSGRAPIRFVHDGGPGALVVENLPVGLVNIEVRSIEGVTQLQTTIPPAPYGDELCRIATISDLHLGSGNWGTLRTIRDIEPEAEDHYDMRCAEAAIQEAIDWGASLLVIKGDAAHHRRTRDFELVGELVDRFPKLPMIMIPGNHDVDDAWPIEIPQSVGRRGLPYEFGVRVHDMPGVRMSVGNTCIEHVHAGSIEAVRDELLEAAAEASNPNLMLLHHQFQQHPVLTYWPPGIPFRESQQFLTDLAKAAPRTLVSSGHTHRNRIRRVKTVLVTEVGAAKDWPGSWAGYRVFEGGIYQTVRRVAEPSAIRWTEYSRRAVGGLWSAWSPGKLTDRCAGL